MLLCRVSINAALFGTQIRKRPEVLANEKKWTLMKSGNTKLLWTEIVKRKSNKS